MNKRDYYKVLGVERNADEESIKKAYRKLAMQYHPDRNQNDKSAEDKFKEIGEAYSILSDQGKKAQYDRFGHTGMSGQGGFGGFSQEGFDPFDLFKTVFSGFGGGFGGFGEDIFGRTGTSGRRQAAWRGSDLSVNLKLTLDEIADGTTKKVKIKVMVPCKTCSGTGSRGGKTAVCPKCSGSGEVRQVVDSLFGRVVNITTCTNCGGGGRVIADACDNCHGSGLTREEKTVSIKVPAGVSGGNYIRMRGEGNHGQRGGHPGDILVGIEEKPHEYFSRHGDDVLYEQTITYPQAVLGTSVEVPTLGDSVKLTIPPGTTSGKLFRLKGKGVAHLNSTGRGDQLVRVTIHVSRKVSANEKRLLEELEEEISKHIDNPKPFFKKVKDAFS